jgi:glycosyltransferase involved in cell wall biosynthesis
VKLSVAIPCYNEASTIEPLLRAVRSAPWDPKEIIVVDDCSTDGTRERLAALGDLVNILLFHDRNRGKGAALRTAFAAATGDVVLVQDADLEYDPAEYPKLVAPIASGEADVVYGSRFLGKRPSPQWHRLGNALLTSASNIMTGLRLTDMETCYKAFRRTVIQSVAIEEDRFGFEPEITAKIARMGCRIVEVPVSYAPRSYAEGKKIGVRDGLRTLWCIVKYGLERRP